MKYYFYTCEVLRICNLFRTGPKSDEQESVCSSNEQKCSSHRIKVKSCMHGIVSKDSWVFGFWLHSLWRRRKCQQSRLLQHFDANQVIDQFLFQDKHRPRRSLLIAAPSSSRFSSGGRVGLPIGYPRRSGWVCHLHDMGIFHRDIRDLKISDGDVNENVISKYNFALS